MTYHVVNVTYDMLMMLYVGPRPSCVQCECPESYEACAAPQILAAPAPVHPDA